MNRQEKSIRKLVIILNSLLIHIKFIFSWFSIRKQNTLFRCESCKLFKSFNPFLNHNIVYFYFFLSKNNHSIVMSFLAKYSFIHFIGYFSLNVYVLLFLFHFSERRKCFMHFYVYGENLFTENYY